MKQILLLVISVYFLTACAGPAPPNPELDAEAAQAKPAARPTATTEPEEPVNSAQNAADRALDLTWSTEADALILQATNCCGHVQPVTQLNYLPEAQLWGDGRFIWVAAHDDGSRQVFEAHLTTAQIEALLARIAADGFFEWEERYAESDVADAADQCLMVTLTAQSKQVCQVVSGAPKAYPDLYDYLAAGAGVTGTPYLPERAYLTAHLLKLPADFTPPLDATWPADAGFSLAEAVEGRWIEGAVLETTWEIVNAKWAGMIVQDEDAFYAISLQVPGLSQTEPPTW